MLAKPSVPPKARLLIDELRSDGIELTDSEVIWLYVLGENVKKPPTAGNGEIAGMIHQCAGVDFHYPGVGARVWLNEFGLKAFPVDAPARPDGSSMADYLSILFAFASAHSSRDGKDVLRRLSDPSAIFTAVMNWAMDNLSNCTSGELEAVLDLVYPDDPLSIPPTKEEAASEAEPFSRAISRVCDEVGGDVESWTWDYSFQTFLDQIAYIGDKASAESDQTSSADPSLRALQALMYAGDVIRHERGMNQKYLPDRVIHGG